MPSFVSLCNQNHSILTGSSVAENHNYQQKLSNTYLHHSNKDFISSLAKSTVFQSVYSYMKQKMLLMVREELS